MGTSSTLKNYHEAERRIYTKILKTLCFLTCRDKKIIGLMAAGRGPNCNGIICMKIYFVFIDKPYKGG
ncbi:hypothetical protein DOT_0608 [Desulfosporosinus sp. OT]|nr:hypothetical protein DOT_0608 [Desulfosporosinus sp. OT]